MTRKDFLLMMAGGMTLNAAEKSSFTFPDEWEKHDGTIMIFPARHSYGRKTQALQKEFAELANTIQKNEQVYAFVHSNDKDAAKALLDKNIKTFIGEKYRIDWARDNAPMFISNGKKLKAVCFQFNGWGKKYRGWQHDVGVNKAIAKALKIDIIDSPFVLEGGAIEIGSSKIGQIGIATKQCVLNKNRTNWSQQKVEKELCSKLGLKKIIWIDKGLNPDPITDGHVDGLLKFVAHNTVMLHTTDDDTDENYQSCLDAKKILQKAGLKVIEMPLADDIVHMNFYIGSGGKVIYVPVCGDKQQDKPALTLLKKHFKKVIPIKATAMAEAGGGIHCYTQQIPAVK